MVIDDQRFIVARDINGEPSGAGERAADQLQVAGVGGNLRYAATASYRGELQPIVCKSYTTAWPSVGVPWMFDR